MSWIREENINVANILKVISLNPRAMEAVRGLRPAIASGPGALTPVQVEAIATTVSVINRCRY